MTNTTTPRTRTRDEAIEYLDREIARPNPDFSTYDPEYLRGYQRHVRRWINCAPEGATFLVAPLQGWDGTPCGVRNPQGPQTMLVNPAMRKVIREKHGEDPFERANRIWAANHPEAVA